MNPVATCLNETTSLVFTALSHLFYHIQFISFMFCSLYTLANIKHMMGQLLFI